MFKETIQIYTTENGDLIKEVATLHKMTRTNLTTREVTVYER